MEAVFIIIGNELLNGKINDLNSSFLGKKLLEYGHNLREVQIVGDNENLLNSKLEQLQNSSDLVFISGGLGPTKDDLTKSILSNFFNTKIENHAEAKRITLEHFKRGNRDYDEALMHYHLMPKNFTPIYNPVGYAPGIFINSSDQKFFALPGVPSEFQEMLNHEIFPKHIPKTSHLYKHIIIKTYKIGESKIFNEVAPTLWKDLSVYGEVSSLPHQVGVDIGITIKAENQQELEAQEKNIIKTVQSSPIANSIWHIGPESIEEVIIKKAQDKNITIGFSESCTGGLLASRITDIAGSSSVFWGSVISYANEVKMNSLAVSEETLKNFGAVSKETAYEMAQGARKSLKVDIAVSTTGIAGPGGATQGKPVGTVGIGVSTKNETQSQIYNFRGNRTSLKQSFSQAALFIMLEAINSFE